MFYVDIIARGLAKEQLKGNIMRKHLPSITSLPSFQTSPNTHQSPIQTIVPFLLFISLSTTLTISRNSLSETKTPFPFQKWGSITSHHIPPHAFEVMLLG
jgi:hypothetical protein